MSFKASAVAFIAAALLGAMSAQAEQSVNLAGVWGFETAPESSENCVISGRAQVTPTSNANRFNVRMRVLQHCDVSEDVHTERECTATRTGQDVTIDCRLLAEPSTPYLPDNFTLEIRSPALMEGHLVSGWIAPAAWRREGEAFVS